MSKVGLDIQTAETINAAAEANERCAANSPFNPANIKAEKCSRGYEKIMNVLARSGCFK